MDDIKQIRALLDIDTAIGPVDGFSGGTARAISRLTRFIDTRLDSFPEERNDPSLDCLSNMSPYLHFGQVSPLRVSLMVSATGSGGRDAYLEELVVRRELAINFVRYNPQYDSYSGFPTGAERHVRATPRTEGSMCTRCRNWRAPGHTTRSGMPPRRRCGSGERCTGT